MSKSKKNTPGEEARKTLVEELNTGNSNARRLIPFSYLGGKYKHLNWLLPLLPNNETYVEPFGGSGSVLLNREPAEVETFNDLYSEVINFFKCLRENPDELMQKIALTPYSEEEFLSSININSNDSDLERARKFFVVVNESYDKNLHNPNWSYSINFSSRGVSKKISSYQAKLSRLQPIADRLTDVQITNRDGIDVIQTFDTDKGLIYADPPYPPEVREFEDAYAVEMKEDDHREMGEVLRRCEADVAISTYMTDLYEDMFVNNGWQRVDAEEKRLSSSVGDGTTRTESLYVNYDISDKKLDSAFN
jgi:DNA adenine methylase